mgnify:CR=1 FL=1
MAGGAVAFHPEIRLDEIWHEGNVRDIEPWCNQRRFELCDQRHFTGADLRQQLNEIIR